MASLAAAAGNVIKIIYVKVIDLSEMAFFAAAGVIKIIYVKIIDLSKMASFAAAAAVVKTIYAKVINQWKFDIIPFVKNAADAADNAINQAAVALARSFKSCPQHTTDALDFVAFCVNLAGFLLCLVLLAPILRGFGVAVVFAVIAALVLGVGARSLGYCS